jgi:hypothetical protein
VFSGIAFFTDEVDSAHALLETSAGA